MGGNSAAERARDPIVKYCQNGKTVGRPTFSGDMRDQRSFTYWSTLWLSALREKAKESAYCMIFTDWRQLPAVTDAVQAAGWSWRGVIAWNKGRGSRAPHRGFVRHQCEYIVWGTNGRVPKLTDRGPFDGCYDHKVKQSDKFHMTGKPTPLLRELVKVAPVGGTVLDPFAGSSTTLVAASLEGRKSIGFELSEDYCDISIERLKGMSERSCK